MFGQSIKSVSDIEYRIFIAGNVDIIRQACRKFCSNVGLCVTVTPTHYIYKGGEEDGVIIGLINYARFPKGANELLETSQKLAEFVRVEACQESYTILGEGFSHWVSYREADQPKS